VHKRYRSGPHGPAEPRFGASAHGEKPRAEIFDHLNLLEHSEIVLFPPIAAALLRGKG
jgi:hypothetical protein